MFEAFVGDWAWLVWLGLILAFIVVEVTTGEFTFLMFAIGGLGGLLLGLLQAPWWAQIVIAGIIAVLLLFTVRPWLHRRLHGSGEDVKTNVDALVGMRGTVVREFEDGQGQVKLANGETWTSRLESGGALHEGEKVVVTAIEGATAVVAPASDSAMEGRAS